MAIRLPKLLLLAGFLALCATRLSANHPKPLLVGCGDTFTDPGGATGNYFDGNVTVMTLCPDQPGDFIEVRFTSFETEACCDFLSVYDADNIFGGYIGAWSGTAIPETFSATNPTGCLTFYFNPQGAVTAPGWTAEVTCSPCPRPNLFQVNKVSGSTAQFSWWQAGAGVNYAWEIGLPGFVPGTGAATVSGTTGDLFAIADNLAHATEYEAYLRSNCPGGAGSSEFAGPVSFRTSPGCGDAFFDSGGPLGNYDILSNPATTICPDVPGTYVSLEFQQFAMPSCCQLAISNGGGNVAFGDIGIYAGTNIPSLLTSVDPTGCLTLSIYQTGLAESAAGWLGTVNCVSCPSLNWAAAIYLTSQGATLQWHQVPAAVGYVWEVGAEGFAPGTVAALASGSSTSLDAAVQGLESGTRYDAYVAVLCQTGDTSAWQKITFTTLPTCGDDFFDPGGPDGDPLPNLDQSTLICPEQPGQYASLTFSEFDLEPCCAYLEIFNSNYHGGEFLGYLTGSQIPQTVTATNASGCLYVRFLSNGNQADVGSGWKAHIDCVTCPNPLGLTVSAPYQTEADLSWQFLPGASFYTYEIGAPGFVPGTGAALFSSNVNANQVHITGLESGTAYEVYVRANCSGNDVSTFTGPVAFSTIPTCGDTLFVAGGTAPQTGVLYQTICPDNPGEFVQLTFDDFNLPPCCSYIEIWDADNFWGPLLGSFTGTNSPGVVAATNSTGCLSIHFQANSGSDWDGFSAAVECVTCPVPANLSTYNIKKDGVELAWSHLPTASFYTWEIGLPGFIPGTGTAVASGDVTGTNIVVTGLESGTAYLVYLRANCAGSDISAFSNPKFFQTAPTCGDLFFDPAGATGEVSGYFEVVTPICPDVPGTFASIDFSEFDLGECCSFLEVYDYEGTWSNYLGNWKQQNNPGTLTATNPGGCLTVRFASQDYTPAPGWAASVSCVTCPSPNGLATTNLTGSSVKLDWWQAANAEFYRWEIGAPGFVPGTGEAIFSSNTPTNFATVNGLEGNTEYEAYVRSTCLGGETGEFRGPVKFKTFPTCGDTFTDPGGADANYPTNQYVPVQICPETPGDYVQLDFLAFEMNSCCASLSITDNITYQSYSGTNSPGTVISNAPGGCLTVTFQSNDQQTAPGFEAAVSCVSCAYTNHVVAGPATFSTLYFSWTGLPDATSYEWEVGLPGFVPGTGTAAASGTTANLFVTAQGLESATEYEIYVRTNCGGGDVSAFSKPLKSVTAPTCGDHYYDPGGAAGNYQPYVQSITTICPDVPGQSVEVVFNGFHIHGWEDYFYVYDGDNTSAPLIGNYQGTIAPPVLTANNPSGCLTFSFSPQSGQSYSGWDAVVNCVACPKVGGVTVSNVSAGFATIAWHPLPDPSATFEWEVGEPGFVPGTGSALFSGTSAVTSVQVTGLQSNTNYEVYVRGNCGANGLGNFSTAVTFKTAIACGDFFYDSGGPNGNYNNYESATTTICPQAPGQMVEVIFTEFSTEGCCDYLAIYDGNSTAGIYLGSYSGGNIPPPTVATNASGCLTFVWYSDGSSVSSGWAAEVNCGGCIAPLNFEASEIASDGATLTWEALPEATSYHWEIGAPGFAPGIGQNLFIGNESVNSVDVLGLAAGVNYEAYVRAICGSEGPGEFAGPLAFSTLISCGNTSYDTGGEAGDYGANEDYFVRICPDAAGDSVSLVFHFFETQQGVDFLEILNGSTETSPSLGAFSGNALPPMLTSTDASGCLMLHFTSNATVHRGGWEAEIRCGSTATVAGNFEGDFEAFPNPASSKLTISFTYPAPEMAAVSLLDLTGRAVLTEKMQAVAGGNVLSLDVAGLPPGAYFVRLTGAFGTAVRRVAKE